MGIEVHTETIKRRFVSDWLSIACLLNFLIVFGAAILPLYISWASTLWIREKVVLEQLDVAFTGGVIAEVQGLKPLGNSRIPFINVWSSSPVVNSLYGTESVRPMIVSLTPVDRNGDGRMDEGSLGLQVPLASDESIQSVTILAFATTRINGATRLTMDSALVAHVASGVPIQAAVIEGELTLRQRDSLPRPVGGVYSPYLSRPLQAMDTAVAVEQVTVAAYLQALAARNFSLAFTTAAPIVEADTWVPKAVPDVAVGVPLQPRTVRVDVTFRLPRAPVVVKATISEELKWGWIQYLSFLVITAYLAYLLRTALFGWRLVETAVLVDAPRAASKLHVA